MRMGPFALFFILAIVAGESHAEQWQPAYCPPGLVGVKIRRAGDDLPHPQLCLAPALTHVICDAGCYVFALRVDGGCPLSLGLKDDDQKLLWAEPFIGQIDARLIASGRVTLAIGQCLETAAQ